MMKPSLTIFSLFLMIPSFSIAPASAQSGYMKEFGGYSSHQQKKTSHTLNSKTYTNKSAPQYKMLQVKSGGFKNTGLKTKGFFNGSSDEMRVKGLRPSFRHYSVL